MGEIVSTLKKKKVEVCISDFPSVHSPSLNPLCNWQNENSFIYMSPFKNWLGQDKVMNGCLRALMKSYIYFLKSLPT